MRVALVGPTYPYRGGIAHHTTLLSEALRKKHDLLFVSFTRQYPKFLFPGKSDKEPGAKAVAETQVEYLLDSMNPLSWVATARRIARFKPELLILPWWVAFWAPQFWTLSFLVRRFCRVRVVLMCHNVLEHEAGIFKAVATRLMFSCADRIVTQSASETERARNLLGEGASITTGFHPTYAPLAKDVPDVAEARKILQLGKKKVLLFFGFVRPYKGLDVLLEAMPKIIAKHDVLLLVVGEFWKDKGRYLQQIQDLNIEQCVRIHDEYVPNEAVGRYFAAADLVVQPYRSATGSGISQLAYGFGKPVVATRVGNLDEVVEDGVSGRLVPPGDAKALAAAVNESLEDGVLQPMSQNAALVAEKFSWDRLAELFHH
jgi:glycosyltransferase involved in cell wall biosynthesis